MNGETPENRYGIPRIDADLKRADRDMGRIEAATDRDTSFVNAVDRELERIGHALALIPEKIARTSPPIQALIALRRQYAERLQHLRTSLLQTTSAPAK